MGIGMEVMRIIHVDGESLFIFRTKENEIYALTNSVR
jgi:hypothetical protein